MTVNSSEKEGIEGKTFVVTGGLGHVGSALCLELVRRGAHQVQAFDLRKTSPRSDDLKNIYGVHCIQGDVSSKEDVEKALRGADCVFHIASYGKSGKEMLQSARIDEVNINGTRNVIEACVELGIQRLVYMSSDKVVFGGKKIVNGDEYLPYAPTDGHFDQYERSKSVAEQLVLKNNGSPLKKNNMKCLYTCAVRPGTVYGPGEDTHLPRIVSNAKLGLLLSKIGEPSVKTDWIYVDNLVLALILASKGLLDDIPGKTGQPVAAGQPYFVSDDSPVNTFEFIGPLLKSLDYDLPKFWLAVSPALFIARIFALLYSFLNPWLNRWWIPQPLILPNEVYKVGVTHYFSTRKAKEELGYVPMVNPREGMVATIKYWQDRKLESMDGPTLYYWILCAVTMPGLTSIVLLDDIGPVPFMRSIGLFFLRSMSVAKFVFVTGSISHIGQGICAYFIAKRVDPANARAWFWQTTFLGMFSFRFILKRALRT